MADSPPQVNAFLLCDQAFQQLGTGKWCIIGTFGVIWAREFPVTHAPLMVFVGLSDFRGNANVQVLIRDSEGEQIVAVNAQVPQLPPNSMSVAEFAFAFPPVTFKEAGSYTLELLASDQFLAARSFRVDEPPKMKPGQLPPWMRPPGAGPQQGPPEQQDPGDRLA